MFKLAQKLIKTMQSAERALGGSYAPSIADSTAVKNINGKFTPGGATGLSSTNFGSGTNTMQYAFDSPAFKGQKIFKAPYAGTKSGYIQGNQDALNLFLDTNREYNRRTGKNLNLRWGDEFSAYRSPESHAKLNPAHTGGTGGANSHSHGSAFDIAQLDPDPKYYDPIAAEVIKQKGWKNVGKWDPTHIVYGKSW